MDRRDLIIKAGATALATGTAARLLGAPGDPVITTKPGPLVGPKVDPNILTTKLCRPRPNIAALTKAQMAALKAGVAAMKARGPNDPTSWSYQAAMHATFTTPTKPLWNGCQHGNLDFFSWHRLFLYYFERILRAASGSPSLMLPYWNFTADRALPAAFRDASPGNPLFTANRGAGINGGALLPASSVAIAGPLANVPFNDFSNDLEASPHGAVHVSIGGLMQSVPTAGQDPIFWLHHCNIDRLWEVWIGQGGGRANPTGAAWLDHDWTFFDETGTQRTVKSRKGLATCKGLGYNYAPRFRIPRLPNILINAVDEPRAAQVRAPAGAVDTARGVTLSGRAATATLALPPVRAGAVAQRTYLAFDDIDVTNPEGFYEIYINPPRGKANLDFTDPSYAGNLVLFGLSERDRAVKHGDHGAMAGAKPRKVFDITRKLAQLRATPGFDAKALDVVLVLRLPEGGGRPAAAVDAPRVEVGKVRLIAG